MKAGKILLACLAFAFLFSCGTSDSHQSFELGTLEIVDGPVIANPYDPIS